MEGGETGGGAVMLSYNKGNNKPHVEATEAALAHPNAILPDSFISHRRTGTRRAKQGARSSAPENPAV